ncbi:phage major capsid protein [Dysgonomonas sp. GY617]|uniref:phage major capsid protein n=1 Tax=Dysgonomonas sp. GY617 TaxID=2780420 RepID=UPI0018842745|nr:phage major capsid protein [Dysgonomonas sp. GY617]MBF0577734.1 phage major capsid protein [Dysgonomonas sp. GY617]
MKLKKADKKRMRARMMEINDRIGELADTLAKEERKLSKEEADERDAISVEKDLLQLRLLQDEQGTLPVQEISNERAFTQIVSGLMTNREVPEECRSLIVEDKGVLGLAIPMNRDIQDTESVQPVIPLTIGDIIEPLEQGLILNKVGLKMQYGMTGAWQFPVVAGVEATLEDENVEISDTTIDISKINPTPRRVAISIPVSNRAIDQSNNVILAIVKTQMSLSVTRLLNRWMFSRTKITVKASEGCFVNPTTKLTYSTDIAWRDVVALEGGVISTGAIIDGTGAYVCSGKTYAALKSTPKDAGSGLMLIENGLMNGYPVFITEHIGNDALGFGIFSYQMLGQFGQMRMIVDPYTGAKRNLVYFVFNTDFDMLTLRTEAFGILSKETPTT